MKIAFLADFLQKTYFSREFGQLHPSIGYFFALPPTESFFLTSEKGPNFSDIWLDFILRFTSSSK